MTISKITAVVVIATLLVWDQVSKILFPTEDWAWHDKGIPPIWIVLPFVVMVACAIFWPIMRLPASVCLAGVLGNGISIYLGDVANPFQTQVQGYLIAFNMADVYLISSIFLILIAAGALLSRRVRV